MGTPEKKIPKNDLFRVNLLIHKGGQIPVYTKLLRWLLSSGRFIVVFVEIIVISAFIYRYKLDAELADLQDKIKEQIPYLQSLKDDELLIKKTQFQLSTIKQTKQENPEFAKVLLEIAQLTPRTIRLTNISFDRLQSFPKTNISVTGRTPSNIDLSAFLKALQKNPNFINISLTNISFEGETNFTITGVLNGKGVSS